MLQHWYLNVRFKQAKSIHCSLVIYLLSLSNVVLGNQQVHICFTLVSWLPKQEIGTLSEALGYQIEN